MRSLLALVVVALLLASCGPTASQQEVSQIDARPAVLHGEAETSPTQPTNVPPPTIEVITQIVPSTVVVEPGPNPRSTPSGRCPEYEISFEGRVDERMRIIIPPVLRSEDVPSRFTYGWGIERPDGVTTQNGSRPAPPDLLLQPLNCDGAATVYVFRRVATPSEPGGIFRIESWHCPSDSPSAAEEFLRRHSTALAQEDGWKVHTVPCPATPSIDGCVAYRRTGRAIFERTELEVTSCHVAIRQRRHVAGLTTFALGSDANCEQALLLADKIAFRLHCLPEDF